MRGKRTVIERLGGLRVGLVDVVAHDAADAVGADDEICAHGGAVLVRDEGVLLVLFHRGDFAAGLERNGVLDAGDEDLEQLGARKDERVVSDAASVSECKVEELG